MARYPQKNGTSALGLQRVLGLGSYRRPRLGYTSRAVVRPGRERLSGSRRDLLGSSEEGVSKRQTEGKALIAVAVEEKGAGMGRLRMRRVRGASAASLIAFVEESVEPDRDGWLGYELLEKKCHRHRIVFLPGRRKDPSERCH